MLNYADKLKQIIMLEYDAFTKNNSTWTTDFHTLCCWKTSRYLNLGESC